MTKLLSNTIFLAATFYVANGKIGVVTDNDTSNTIHTPTFSAGGRSLLLNNVFLVSKKSPRKSIRGRREQIRIGCSGSFSISDSADGCSDEPAITMGSDQPSSRSKISRSTPTSPASPPASPPESPPISPLSSSPSISSLTNAPTSSPGTTATSSPISSPTSSPTSSPASPSISHPTSPPISPSTPPSLPILQIILPIATSTPTSNGNKCLSKPCPKKYFRIISKFQKGKKKYCLQPKEGEEPAHFLYTRFCGNFGAKQFFFEDNEGRYRSKFYRKKCLTKGSDLDVKHKQMLMLAPCIDRSLADQKVYRVNGNRETGVILLGSDEKYAITIKKRIPQNSEIKLKPYTEGKMSDTQRWQIKGKGRGN